MKFITFFIIYSVLFVIFYWIIKEINIFKKLFSKHRSKKQHKAILFLTLFLSALPLGFAKELTNIKYVFPNYISIIISAFSWSIYINIARSYIKEAK
ncbi:hypothetical protein [Oceanirhabdus seepicola]|uniref:Uncharacterized protein n=1 Tax=Oceanirhabdus seepicola TaxID=2828781 RepID=A0A9J6NXN1_9CLOT|nr:hypothetical protein [Oceanirhabdus seepicola]MCM1989019.1 hypothetical protein [Oceanirhabdus seepicola]